jgi:hypothetical protein
MTREQIAEGQRLARDFKPLRCHPKGAMRVCRRDLSAFHAFQSRCPLHRKGESQRHVIG